MSEAQGPGELERTASSDSVNPGAAAHGAGYTMRRHLKNVEMISAKEVPANGLWNK